MSAPINSRSENIGVLPVIVAELELRNIKRHIFPAHLVECADHTALEDRLEALNGLSMNCADDVLPSRMVNGRVWIVTVKRFVAWILIGAKQADPVRHGFADERGESGRIHVRDYTRNNISLAADSADDWRFAGASGPTATATFVPMPVFRRRTFHRPRQFRRAYQYPA